MKQELFLLSFIFFPTLCFAQGSGDQHHGTTGTKVRYDNFSPKEKPLVNPPSQPTPAHSGNSNSPATSSDFIEEPLPENGIATHFYANGTYTGEWKDSKRNGHGSENWGSSQYEGEWKDDCCEGHGIYRDAWGFVMNAQHGYVYDGEWKNGKMEGEGTLITSKDIKYVGTWKNNKREGFGILSQVPQLNLNAAAFDSGSRYEGEWKNDMKNGKGKCLWPDGIKYDGDWKNDMKNGKGKCSWPDGNKYDGEWKDDKMDGQGTLQIPTGEKYEGMWRADKQNGFGKLYNKDGKVNFEGFWKNDRYVGKNNDTETDVKPDPAQFQAIPDVDNMDQAVDRLDIYAVKYFLFKGTELFRYYGSPFSDVLPYYNYKDTKDIDDTEKIRVRLEILQLLLEKVKSVEVTHWRTPKPNVLEMTLMQTCATVSQNRTIPLYDDAMELLLKYGADPNYQDISGYFPLLKAESNINVKQVKMLLAYGADRNLKTNHGTTALADAKDRLRLIGNEHCAACLEKINEIISVLEKP